MIENYARRLILGLGLLILGNCLTPAIQAQKPIVVKNCNVTLISDVDVAAQEAGVLMKFFVKEGSVVEKDKNLAQINDADAKLKFESVKLEYDVAKKEAANDINIKAAEAAAKVASAELKESIAVNEKVKGAIPKTQIDRERLTETRAYLQVDVAKLEHEVAGLTSQVRESQLKIADLSVKRRAVKSPIKGVVERRYKDVGEWVQPGEPIMQVIHMDRLRIEGFLSVAEAAPTAIIGRKVTVKISLKQGDASSASDGKELSVQSFKGKIDFVSNQIQAGGEYRVWAEVANRQTPQGHWVLRPGMIGTMTITFND